MKLEAVIVCVNYSDFLAHTLPTNKQFFDRIVVVTDTKDLKTKHICEYYHIECIQTDSFYKDGVFNKANGINEGLKRISRADWVVQMDADIYLPPLTRTILEKINKHLLKDSLYTMDRMMCPTYEAWQQHLINPTHTHTGFIYIHPTLFPIGVRIAEYMNEGYEPIGYFQMWNPNGSNIHTYPTDGIGADRTDVLHAKAFPRSKRVLLPELICIHLDSEDLNLKDMGKNWFGRKTKEFSPNTSTHNSQVKPSHEGGYKPIDDHKDHHIEEKKESPKSDKKRFNKWNIFGILLVVSELICIVHLAKN